MKKKQPFLPLVFVPLFLLLSGCASVMNTNNQMQFGIKAAQKELWDEAIFRWEKVLETHAESGAAYNNLAVAYEKKGDWDSAEKAYEAAVKFAPNNKYIESNYSKFKTRFESQEKKDAEKKKNEKK